MRAFALKEFGVEGAVVDLPVPEPGEGEVRVKVDAAGINPIDIFVTRGFLKDRAPHNFPLVPGLDLAGTVDAVGPGVEDLKPGDPVFGVVGKTTFGRGSLAEYVVALAATLAKRPAGFDPVKGAALPLAGVSALTSVDAASVKKGDLVVVVGAGGGVGSIAVELAARMGAHVIGVAGTDKKAYVLGLGAREFIDHTAGDVAAQIRTAHPDGVDALVDSISEGPALESLAQLVKDGGKVTSMRGAAAVDELAKRRITGTNVMAQTTSKSLERLVEALNDESKVAIKAFPLEKAGEALNELASGHVRGKLVVLIG